VLLLDSTPHGRLSSYKPQVSVRRLFQEGMDVISLLESPVVGLNCTPADFEVLNPNYVEDFGINSSIAQVYDALTMAYYNDADFKYKKTELEVNLQGGPILGTRGPTVPNDHWGIVGGWNYSLSKIDLHLAFYDDWFLERLPPDYSQGLLNKGWPTLGVYRLAKFGVGQTSAMINLHFFDAWSITVAGELRAIFWLCLIFYQPDAATGLTRECHKGGSVWQDPNTFLSVTLPRAILHGVPGENCEPAGKHSTQTGPMPMKRKLFKRSQHSKNKGKGKLSGTPHRK